MGKSLSDVRRVQQAFEEFVEDIDQDASVSICEAPNGDGYAFLVLVFDKAVVSRVPAKFDDIAVTVTFASEPHSLTAEWTSQS